MRRDVLQFTQLFSVPSSSHVFQFLTFTAYGGFQHANKKKFSLFYRKRQAKVFIIFERLDFHPKISHSTIGASSCKR